MKSEIYENTQHIRRSFGRKIKVFDPLSPTYGYDPFYVFNKTNNQAQEAEAIAMALIPLPPDIKDPFWIQNAQNLFTGLILHFYNKNLPFIGAITEILSNPIMKLVDDIYDHTEIPDVKLYLNAFRDMPVKTLASVYAELSRHIMVFATDKNIKECFSQIEKITPDDLEQGIDVFICIPEHLLRQWKNLLTLIVSQFIRHCEQRPDRTAKPILFLLDEFPRLGKIEFATEAFTTLRSKGITMCIAIQSLAQLDLTYGEHTRRVIADNCQYKAIFNATDADSQAYFSKLVGTYDKTKVSTDKRFAPITGFPAGTGRHITTEEKPKIKPEDFATLDKIALFTPMGFFRVDRIPYYK